MDILRGVCVGGAVGGGIAIAIRMLNKEPRQIDLGVQAHNLPRFAALAINIQKYRDGDPRSYADLVAAADEFSGHILHFSRTAQFKCNRLIADMQRHARVAASHNAALREEHERIWPEVDKLCHDTLHNLILDLR